MAKFLDESGVAELWAKTCGKAEALSGFIPTYLALVGNVNADMVDAALGKNNESRVSGIGKALAMYAWWKGETDAFTELQKCGTLAEITSNAVAYSECSSNKALMDLLLSTYAADEYIEKGFLSVIRSAAGTTEDKTFAEFLSNEEYVNNILNSKDALNAIISHTEVSSIYPAKAMYESPIIATKFDVYTEIGTQEITIPDDVDSVLVVLIGGGGNSVSSTSKNNRAGGYRVFAVDTKVQKKWSITVPDAEETARFGDFEALGAVGHDLYGSNSNCYLCGLSGDGASAPRENRGGTGGGGYGGAAGNNCTSTSNKGGGGQGGYGGGSAEDFTYSSTTSKGGAGTGYYGDGGAGAKCTTADSKGGQGCVVVYYSR